MKKIFSLTIVTAMLTSIAVVTTVSADTPKGNADYFASKTETKITVDGKKDASYAEAPIYIKTPADDASAAGAKGVVSLAWDNEYLYVFNEVTDAAITPENAVTSMWSDDGMEVYINLSGEEADYYSDGINAGQYTVGPFFSDWGGGGYHRNNNMDISEYAWEITDKGYNIELAIYWGDEFEAAEGKHIRGFFAVNDTIDGDPSTREYRNISTEADMPDAWHIADNTWPVIELVGAETAVIDTPVVEEVVDTPVVEAPQTFDFGVIATITAIISVTGCAISKKR